LRSFYRYRGTFGKLARFFALRAEAATDGKVFLPYLVGSNAKHHG
jgi:hypothetical protein